MIVQKLYMAYPPSYIVKNEYFFLLRSTDTRAHRVLPESGPSLGPVRVRGLKIYFDQFPGIQFNTRGI